MPWCSGFGVKADSRAAVACVFGWDSGPFVHDAFWLAVLVTSSSLVLGIVRGMRSFFTVGGFRFAICFSIP